MRFDLTVNMLTAQALKNKKITVFGGNQIRPNIHIRDLVRVYLHFLDKQDLPTAVYNAGFENLTVLQVAEAIKEQTQAEIVLSKSNDPRSYRLNSSLLLSTGFSPKSNVRNAIKEVIGLVNSGFDVDRKEWKTVESLRSLKLTEKTDD
jgi:nucleoside-diphosphate-sugar epimerase